MRRLIRVLRAMGQWLGGAALFVALSVAFLGFAEDGAKPTPELQRLEYLWFYWSVGIGVVVGWPVWQIASAIHYQWTHPPEIEFLRAIGDALEQAHLGQRGRRARIVEVIVEAKERQAPEESLLLPPPNPD